MYKFINVFDGCLKNFISPGKCFVDLSEEIKDVYAVYCRNHDDAISLMEKVTLIYDMQTELTKDRYLQDFPNMEK